MTVLVTGAAGHVGANLVRSLLAQGTNVRVLVRNDRRALQGLNVQVVEGDVRDPAAVGRAVDGCETVYHAAGHISLSMKDWPLVESVNVIGAGNVVDACLASGVRRLIHFSSIHAIDAQRTSGRIDESCLRAIDSALPPYDRSKAAGEAVVRRGMKRGLDAVILNPTAVIGPNDYRPSHFGQFLLLVARGRVPAVIPGGFDWVDVRDVAETAIRAATAAPAGAQYLVGGHWVSARDLAAMAAGIAGVRPPLVVCPTALANVGAPVMEWWGRMRGKRPLFTQVSLRALASPCDVDCSRAARDLGHAPRPFETTLRETLAWFVEAGMLPERAPASSGG